MWEKNYYYTASSESQWAFLKIKSMGFGIRPALELDLPVTSLMILDKFFNFSVTHFYWFTDWARKYTLYWIVVSIKWIYISNILIIKLIHCKQSVLDYYSLPVGSALFASITISFEQLNELGSTNNYPHHIICSPFTPQHWWSLGLLRGSRSTRNSQPSRVPDFT